jgi:hypothetical protein
MHRVPDAVHGRAWTKIAKTTPCKVEWTRLAALFAALCPGQKKKKAPT